MKYIKYLCSALLLGGWLTACSDAWDDHFDDSTLATTQEVEVFKGDVSAYLASQPSLSRMAAAYADADSLLRQANGVTVVVTPDGNIGRALTAQESRNLISDVAFAPSSLIDGNGIYMLSGKNLWVTTGDDGRTMLNEKNIEKVVKTDDGFVYYVDGFITVEPSLYEFIQSLGDDYSLFKALIAEFEETYFDASASTPIGVDAMGNTIYRDSVIAVRNSIMDRYNINGLPTWDMRSESYQSTVFIPNNDLIEKAYYSALDSIPVWLNRAVTPQDSLKFRKWMLAACFADRRLSEDEVAPSYEGQYANVGGYIREIDETTDTEKYTEYEAAQWKPSVQTVSTDAVTLSNGLAYFLTDFRIPNHIVIYRAKSRFYQTFAALTAAQQGWNSSTHQPIEGGYFKWINWRDPLIVNEAQGAFELSSTLPTIYYHVLTAVPTEEAFADTLPCAVEYVGLYYNANDRNYGLAEVRLPAGEYYLRMGFKHSLRYSLSVYFGDADEELTEENLCVKDMSMIATGSNFHFDRGGAMEGLDFYGSESIGYEEYFDWRWWYDQDPDLYQKASAYDTDGYQVAVVTLKKPGNFKIRVESSDMSELFMGTYGTDVSDRSKNNVYQLMMYHWCLRPTTNNY